MLRIGLGVREWTRGQSELISYVIVFSFVVIALGTVSMFGVTALQEVRDATTANNAEVAMEALDTNVESIYYGETTGLDTGFTLNSASLETGQEVTIDVRTSSGSVGSAPWTFRPIVYRGDTASLVYENSIVVREEREGAVSVTDHLFRHSSSRTAIPVVKTQTPSTVSISGGTRQIVTTRGTDTESVVTSGSPLTVEFEMTWSGSSLPRRASVWQETLNARIPDSSVPPSRSPPACQPDPSSPDSDIVCRFETDTVVVSVVEVDYEFE